jgi:hypothetical protein
MISDRERRAMGVFSTRVETERALDVLFSNGQDFCNCSRC